MSKVSTSEQKQPVKKEEPKKINTTIQDVQDPSEQNLDELLGSDEFAKQLAAGMEVLKGQMSAEENEKLKQAFEKAWASFDKSEEQTSREVPQSFQD